METVIRAINNEQIKALRRLSQRKVRLEEDSFMLEGVHCVEEALKSHVPLKLIIVEETKQQLYETLLERAPQVPKMVVSLPVMEALSDTRTPQGIMAISPLVTRPWQDAGESGLLLLLENIQDPGNMGTIVRTADAAGVDGILISASSVDVHNAKVVRSTMGSIFHLPIYESQNLPAAVEKLKEDGWAVICGHLDGTDFFTRGSLGEKQALVIGNEAAGVSPEVSRACNYKLKLAMAGEAESLNAAVAAGIMIYDLARTMGRV